MAKNIMRLPIETSDLLDLTPTHLRFLGHYLTNNFMEVDAFRKTYPHKAKEMSTPEIRLEALHLLNQRSIKIAVERYVSSVLDPYRDKLEHQVLTVLRNQAFYDVSDFFYADGSVKPLDSIDADKRHAIDGILTDIKGSQAQATLVNYKLSDKRSAIKMLTELLRKNDSDKETISEITEDSRKRVSDIVSGALAGMEAERQRNNSTQPIKQAEKPVAEDAEIVEEKPAIMQIEYEIENSPIVAKAKELANQQLSGIGVDHSPIVKQARKTAKSVAVAKKAVSK